MKSVDSILYRLAIIIPTHNRIKELKNLLGQIINQKEGHNILIDIVVIVDGSTDGTLKMLEEKYSNVKVVSGDGNWWYTKSMNEGFKYTLNYIKPDYVLTLNDDIALAENYFKKLLSVLAYSDGKSIIGSLGITKSEPTRMVTSGNSWRSKCLSIYKNHITFLKEIDLQELYGIYPSITLPGRGMLIPVSILKKMNGFDEIFKQYHSDSDFALRASEMGFNVLISWDLKIFVDLKKTSGSTSYLNNSIIELLKSFLNPVSRNYLPAKSLFIWRHGNKFCYPFKIILFLVVSFKNIYTKDKL